MGKRFSVEKNKPEKKKITNFILNFMLLIFFILLVISVVKIVNWYLNNRENAKVIEEISEAVTIEEKQEGESEYTVDFNMLKEKNSDTVAWLRVNGTKVEFAVVKAKDNNYYLNHNFNKEYNIAGWIFADYKNQFDGTDKNIVVYGHNMRDDSMFGTIKDVIKEEWYNNQENYKINFITENENAIYEVFSVYQIETEDYYIQTHFENDEKFEEFIHKIKSRSVKDFDTEVTSEDNILTLSTCANNKKYRIVLHAKKID